MNDIANHANIKTERKSLFSKMTHLYVILAGLFILTGCDALGDDNKYYFEYSIDGQQYSDSNPLGQNKDGQHIFINNRENTFALTLNLAPANSNADCFVHVHEFENADTSRFTTLYASSTCNLMNYSFTNSVEDGKTIVSGEFSGTAIADDGTAIEVENGKFRFRVRD